MSKTLKSKNKKAEMVLDKIRANVQVLCYKITGINNKKHQQKMLTIALKTESKLVANTSMKVLNEFENIEDSVDY